MDVLLDAAVVGIAAPDVDTALVGDPAQRQPRDLEPHPALPLAGKKDSERASECAKALRQAIQALSKEVVSIDGPELRLEVADQVATRLLTEPDLGLVVLE